MPRIRFLDRGGLLCCCLLFVGANRLVLGWGGPGMGIVQPKNYASRSGAYSIFVAPKDRWGKGAAEYRFLQNGEIVWSGERPYTLREVTVTDDGHVAGFAYCSTRKSTTKGTSEDESEYLRILILDRRGEELLNATEERKRPPWIANPPQPNRPYVEEFLVDPPNDRVIARMAAHSSQWWVYRLSDGKLLLQADVLNPQVVEDRIARIVDTQPIPGTPLLLTHWYVQDREYKSKLADGLFVLLNADFKEIWRLESPQDFSSRDLFGWFQGPEDYFQKNPAIFASYEPGRFDLRLYSENKRVSFKVMVAGDGTYNVYELGRIAFDVEVTPIVPPTTPLKPVSYLGELQLGSVKSEDSPFNDLWNFTFGPDGLIYFVKKPVDGKSPLVIADSTGAIRGERELEASQIDWSEARRTKDGRFYVTRSKEKPHERGYETSHWIVELASGKESPFPNEGGVGFGGIAWFNDGGWAQVERFVQNSSLVERFRCYGADGVLKWSMGGNGIDDDRLGIGPKDVCVTSDQRLVLLSMSSARIFERDGKLAKTIDLKEGFGKEGKEKYLGYIHEVVCDEQRGFLIANSENPPLVLRYDAQGERRSLWSPHFSDGRTFNMVGGIKVAPDGRLWTSDGRSLLRLADDGVVDLVLGAVPEPNLLEQIVAFATDFKSRLYAASRGTGAVHVFDTGGNALHVCKPDPTDLAGTVTETFVAVNDVGEVYLKKPATQIFMPPDTYLRFSPQGERLGTITFEPSIPVGQFLSSGWAFQPQTNLRCGITDRLIMVEPPNRIIREIHLRPNGKWFSGLDELAMAPDGSMAVLDTDYWSKPEVFELDLFAANGDPLRTIHLSSGERRGNGMAYDGRRVIVAEKAELSVIDTQTGKIDRFSLAPASASDRGWSAHLLPGTDILLLFDKSTGKIHRYLLPPMVAQAESPTEQQAEVVPDPADARIKADWVMEYLREIDAIPDKSNCTVYQRRVNNGSEVLPEERVASLPENERKGLEPIDVGGCGIRFDSPRVFARILDIAATEGFAGPDKKSLLDFGCCDLRPLQALARLGCNVLYQQAGFDLSAMCNDWANVGDLTGLAGRTGHLSVMRYGTLSPDDLKAQGGHDLITIRNLVHKIPADDYYGMEPWLQSGIAFKKDEFVARVFGLLAPGGLLLIYNVAVEPDLPDNAFSRSDWEKAGFKVIALDHDDRGAALGIGLRLKWDAKSSPLEKTIRAKYSLFKRTE